MNQSGRSRFLSNGPNSAAILRDGARGRSKFFPQRHPQAPLGAPRCSRGRGRQSKSPAGFAAAYSIQKLGWGASRSAAAQALDRTDSARLAASVLAASSASPAE
jgi:hypothetical protein